MTEQHAKTQDILQQCLDLLDAASNTVAENQISPAVPILQSIGLAVGHILHAKRQILGDNIE